MAKRMYDINDENIEITKLIKHDSESINCQTVDSGGSTNLFSLIYVNSTDVK